MEKDDTASRTAPDSTILGQSLPVAPSALARKASLIMLSGSEIGREIELLGGEVVVGRSPLAHTTIGDPSISRSHAKILHMKEGESDFYEISDLESRNGTQINGVRVNHARLRNGDKVQLGDVMLKFVLQDAYDSQFYQEIHRRIHYDQLTGLMTMDAFRTRIMAEMEKKDTVFSLAMTDLDGLKSVNDTYGHLAGRMVVREMGALLRKLLREDDVPALYGGDETIILFPHTTIEDAREVAENVRTSFESRVFEFRGSTFSRTISQGLAEWPRQGRTREEIITAADGALYAAKAAGRNCVRLHGA
ncbi:MAG: GGDEF domain-containing protein [FCB group bacterium]|jgi:diguanylate cyclase (GGDEF)-like protein|nr:GGDEF domain-containing protein [FCB group bacterium]